MRFVAILLPLLLLPPPVLTKKDWGAYEFFYYSWPLKSRQNTLYFDYPTAPTDWVAYLITPGNASSPLPAPMNGANTITFTVQNTALRLAPEFRYDTEPANTCVFPAHVRPFVAKRNWAASNSEFDRWWSVEGIELQTGSAASLTVHVNPALWSSVYGRRGDESPEASARFYSAFADPEQLGLSFGGGCFYGHGVYVTGGEMRFELKEFRVE